MNFPRPKYIKLPYTKWGENLLGDVASKIRRALGWRLDENHVNTTHRQDYKDPKKNKVPDEELVCHHFEQEAATADCVKFSVKGGSALVITIPSGYSGNVIEIYEEGGTTPIRKMDKAGAWTT